MDEPMYARAFAHIKPDQAEPTYARPELLVLRTVQKGKHVLDSMQAVFEVAIIQLGAVHV